VTTEKNPETSTGDVRVGVAQPSPVVTTLFSRAGDVDCMDRTARIIGVPMDLGADRRGVDMGPSAIRYAGLSDSLERIGTDCEDGGDVRVPRPEERDPDVGEPKRGTAKYLDEIRDVSKELTERVAATVDDGRLPLVLGGDHSIAVGTVNGVSQDREVGVLWFDAHGDFNTPATTPSGNVHGMSLAALLGLGEFAESRWAHAPNLCEDNVALVGTRTLDEGERRHVRECDVSTFTMHDIDDRSLPQVVDEAIDVAFDGVDAVHVSLDMDWLDPTEAPGVGTPVRGGVTYREAHLAMEVVAERLGDDMSSLEVVEVNPILDTTNETAELATELAASAFGERTL
jgi:arginase